MKTTATAAAAKKPKTRVIRGGRLIDGNGGKVVKDPVIIVEGKRIKAVGVKGRLKEPAGAWLKYARFGRIGSGSFELEVEQWRVNGVRRAGGASPSSRAPITPIR